MHWILHEKSIGFSVEIEVFSKKKKKRKRKVFTEIETIFRRWCAQIKKLFARIFDVLNQMGGDPPPSLPVSYGYAIRVVAKKKICHFCPRFWGILKKIFCLFW